MSGSRNILSGAALQDIMSKMFHWWQQPARQGMQISEEDIDKEKVALVVGVTGIVGSTLAETLLDLETWNVVNPWKVYGVARRPKPEWFMKEPEVAYIQCDLLNREETMAKLSLLVDVTHVFWVVWANMRTEEENSEANSRMFLNAMDALLPNADNLQHICLQTGTKHYTGPFDYVGKASAHEPPLYEGLPRLPYPNFYYVLEDRLFEIAKQRNDMTWSVHRPNLIFGFSPTSAMNIIGTLGVYAAICKREGLPLIFPGNKLAWEHLMDSSDAGLIAEQEIWASVDPKGKNEPFNVVNGDTFSWKRLWNMLAERFAVEVPPYSGEPTSLQAMMQDKGPVWDALVLKHSLFETKLDEVAAWWFADIVLNPAVEMVSLMNKSKEHGFFGYRDSEVSFLYWLDKLVEGKIIPREGYQLVPKDIIVPVPLPEVSLKT